jgi:dipeptidyl-peptidase-4
VDEKAGVVYFMATEKTPLERHLYRVPLGGGEIQQVTREAGTHRIEMAPGAANFLDTFSTRLQPPQQFVIRADGTQAVMLNENRVAALADFGLSKPEFGELKAPDGSKLYTETILPTGFTPAKKYPVLVNVYGGPGVQTVMNSWPGPRGLWLQMMAQKGYIIFAIDNQEPWSCV